jgi:multiple sugar transport system permease protein
MFASVGGVRVYWIAVAILGGVAFAWTVPTIFMLSLSFQSDENLIISTANVALGLFPWPFTIENYVRLLGYDDTPRWFLNSIVVSVVSTALVLLLSSTAGYALARIDFFGRNVILPSCSPA